ncbi:MAG: transcriptional regulator [Sphingobacterium sp.]|jgi:DNA-binding transcriptional LysR family regulator|uniref:LysR family transcriptional regulator n=1 Tax=Sphingobacterium sp. CZ-UAM TaxID=1933868 RepID=UPI000986CAC6|nr:LysR family transcriptional regulator [Sphingobacterium sp. CZ-UAM]MDF2515551.1 transcriptional regulator [Sphingobacterium sp.]OOG19469.1 transcriptional regulator [Sphingobacterium sp. CZ-UAM]
MNYQIELRHLLYFKVLAEELHFRKAAERLFIAQPGLSRQIKQLEENYQVTLFERNKRNVSLTEAGAYLFDEVKELFRHMDQIETQLQSLANGKISTLKLGFIGSAVQTILPQLLVTLKQKQPDIELSLHELANEIQLDLIQKKELDFGFVRLTETPIGLHSLPIHTEHFSLVLPNNHPMLEQEKLDLYQLKNESFILFSKNYSHSYYDLVMSIFQDHQFTPKVTLRTVNALTIFNMVAQGLGVAIVPASLKNGYQVDVRFLELDSLAQRTTLSLVWNAENRNPGIPFVLDIIASQGLKAVITET